MTFDLWFAAMIIGASLGSAVGNPAWGFFTFGTLWFVTELVQERRKRQ